MAVLYVERESQPQKAQFVALTQKDKDGNQMIAGSDNGLIMVDINHQRLHEGRAFIAWNIYPGGTAFTPVRRNRNIVTTSNVAMVTNPTVTTLGTLINRQFITGGTGKKSAGGASGSLEYVLTPLTNYLFRLTNVNGTSHTALLELEWYE